jgi:hypothetical protein
MNEFKIIVRKEKRKNGIVVKDKKKKRPMKRRYGAKSTPYPDQIKYAQEKEYNFLKYWRVVRYWVKRKYELTQEELEVLLYLYDEEVFTRDMFNEFQGLLSYDKTRFKSLQDRGFIIVWRPNNGFKSKKLFTLSVGAKRICSTVYKKLMQDEHIPENHQNNPVFKGDAYMDRMYRKMIRAMNRKKAEQESEEQ